MKLKDIALITGACIAIFLFIVTNANKRTEPAPPELCKVGYANPDGSLTITEDAAGIYNYHIIVTATGVVVLAPCNEL